LASVSAERDNALSDIKRLIEEKARDERKYEDLSAWNRKFYALHFVIILLVPLGLFLYFALRRQNAASSPACRRRNKRQVASIT